MFGDPPLITGETNVEVDGNPSDGAVNPPNPSCFFFYLPSTLRWKSAKRLANVSYY